MIIRRDVRFFVISHKRTIAKVCGLVFAGLTLFAVSKTHTPLEYPCAETGCFTQLVQAKTAQKAQKRSVKGLASWYSVDGCMGCHPLLIMKNGQRLDDTQRTIAYNHAPMNTIVTIRNTQNGKVTTARVTDTGGFERKGKIADLTIATRNALGCTGNCPIEIIFEK